ncbi:MAG TPA: hypothetical protein VHK06_00860, partial [Candidatus Limnocylindria bacterium]|nr:hypothetical protein [Candidatus Limnocylindria bacterium]
EQQGYLAEQGVAIVFKPFNVDQLEDAVARAVELLGKGGVSLARHAVLDEVRNGDGDDGDVKRRQRGGARRQG